MKAQPVRSKVLITHGYRAPDRHVTLIRALPLPPQILSLPVILSPNRCRAQPGSSRSVHCWDLLKPNLTDGAEAEIIKESRKDLRKAVMDQFCGSTQQGHGALLFGPTLV